jgi:hypothetical protein
MMFTPPNHYRLPQKTPALTGESDQNHNFTLTANGPPINGEVIENQGGIVDLQNNQQEN